MPANKVQVNGAHTEGLTVLAFSTDGAYLYSGGSDQMARVWHTDEGTEQEPSAAFDANEPLTCIAASMDIWLTGGADGEVRRYNRGQNEQDGLITTAAGASILDVKIDPKGERVAVASEYVFFDRTLFALHLINPM